MNNISKQQFATILKNELRKRNPSLDIRIEDIPKTNGVVLTALVVISDSSNISPTIYVDPFFEEYKAGYSLKMIIDEIERLYVKCNLEGAYFDIQQFLDYDNIKERLCMKLINAGKNKELLEQVPYRRFHDLAVVYYILLPNESCLQGIASIPVNNKMVEYWNVSEIDMYSMALKNTRHYFKYLVRPMEEVIMEIINEEPETLLEMGMLDLCDERIMYHASNNAKLYGASFILYNDLLEKFSSEHGDFYILPSSVHELLFVPSSVADLDENGLCAMVQDINNNCLDEQEFLSDSIYLFHAETKLLEMIAN